VKRTLGVCYYPEHWDEAVWAEDARRMADLGLTWVRIGEFAWSRLEPSPGCLTFDWLDRAMDVLGNAGLKVVLGTPTATPPRWLVDRMPDMLPVDRLGNTRKFGSRRHYDFSHPGYREECRRITRLLAERYGRHPHLGAWQTDNEYACHDTVLSYSDSARQAFRAWLAQRYQSPEAMNRVHGNVFWSMEVSDWSEVDLPNLTVTEANPSLSLAFRRFASDIVVEFNRIQTDEIRRHSSAPILHNYMGRVTDFDHFAVGADLDAASWDSYPIGFLSDRLENTPERKQRFLRQGDPDNQAFHHDLYRAVGGHGPNGGGPKAGRWWVMEQQPGPVNWAPYNPAPLPGMVRLWTWEAFAHGAEVVSYFRWRQAPFAQEQMHAGLLRPDSAPAPAFHEAGEVARELQGMETMDPVQAPVAVVFDYESAWAWAVQPQGRDFDFFRLAFAAYRAFRRAGLSIDILPPGTADLSGYKVVLAPGLMRLSDPFRAALARFDGIALLGPRTDTKTAELSIPVPLGPDLPGCDVSVVLAESLPPTAEVPLEDGGRFLHWFEHLEGTAPVTLRTTDGRPAMVGQGAVRYLAGWPDDPSFDRIVRALCAEAGVPTLDLPDGLRVRDTARHRFVFNYAPEPQRWNGVTIPAAGVHWETL
jgi:beta-galactosidase